MNRSELVAVSNDAYAHLQNPAISPSAANQYQATISGIRPIYRKLSHDVCAAMIEMTQGTGLEYPDTAFTEAAYDALGTTAADETVGEISRRALLALMANAQAAAPESITDTPDPLVVEQSAAEKAAIKLMRIQKDYELCQLVASGDPQAMEDFYIKYHRLAYKWARRAAPSLRSGVMDIRDLFQETMLYFIQMAARYKTGYDAVFSTFVLKDLPSHLSKAMRAQHTVTLPVTMMQMIARLNALNQARLADQRGVLSETEIAKQFKLLPGGANTPTRYNKLTVGDLYQAKLLTEYMGSLDTGFNPHEENSPVNEYLIDERNAMVKAGGEAEASIEDRTLQTLLEDELEAVLLTLSERQAGVIRLRYGLVDGVPRSLDEIGQVYGVTRSTIQFVIDKAFVKLRHPSRKERLRPFLYLIEGLSDQLRTIDDFPGALDTGATPAGK